MKAKKLVKGMAKRAIGFGGTCTGEHGVGIGKKGYLYEELGYGTVELIRRLRGLLTRLTCLTLARLVIRFSFSPLVV